MLKAPSALALLGLVSLSCGGPGTKGPHKPATDEGDAPRPSLLAKIPATTPYVYAQLDPLPEDYIEHQLLDRLRAFQRFRRALERVRSKNPDADDVLEGLEGAARLPLAFIEQLDGKLSQKGLASLGFDLHGRFALYGQGLWPVLRWELSSGERLKATIERMAQRLDQRFPVLSHGDFEMWHAGELLPGGELDLVVAVQDDELIVAVTPSGDAQGPFLDELLAEEAPGQSLASSGALALLAQRYQFGSGTIGFVDLVRTAQLASAFIPKAEPSCSDELGALFASTPRLIFGTRELTATRLSARLILETNVSVRDALERARASVPSMNRQTAREQLAAVGIGLDTRAFSDFARSRARAVADHKYSCTALDFLPSRARELEEALVGVEESPARSFIGANLLVQAIDMSGGFPKIDAALFLGCRNPRDILKLLATVVPDLATKQIDVGGPPVKIEVAGVSPLVADIFAAAGPRGVAFAGGKGAELLPMVKQEPAGGMPLLLVHVKGSLIRQLNDLTNAGTTETLEHLDPALAETWAEIDRTAYEEMTVEVKAIGDGLHADVDIRYTPSKRR